MLDAWFFHLIASFLQLPGLLKTIHQTKSSLAKCIAHLQSTPIQYQYKRRMTASIISHIKYSIQEGEINIDHRERRGMGEMLPTKRPSIERGRPIIWGLRTLDNGTKKIWSGRVNMRSCVRPVLIIVIWKPPFLVQKGSLQGIVDACRQLRRRGGGVDCSLNNNNGPCFIGCHFEKSFVSFLGTKGGIKCLLYVKRIW